MNEDTTYKFLEAHMLKAAEALDYAYISERSNLLLIPVLKQTARTISKQAEFVVSKQEAIDGGVPPEIGRLFHSPNVKKTESEMRKQLTAEALYELVERGVLLQELRFKKDGKTVDRTLYRMGYGLFRYNETQKEVHIRQEQEERERWLERKRKLSVRAEDVYVRKLGQVLDEIEEALGFAERNELPLLHGARWQRAKRMLFLEFLLALYAVRSQKQSFDWKEIGAVYYQEIGGSKRFDGHKRDFLELAELLLEVPLHYVGLVSLGTVTPILFAGELQEGSVRYECGTVQATTDLAVFRYEYETEAEVLWLVENRAVLTRMAAEEGFLTETRSLVIGVDGQLRSGHKRFVQSVLARSAKLRQVIIWTDSDQAGGTIGKHLFTLVQPYGKRIKWIVPGTVRVVNSWEAYSELPVLDSEQEEQLEGGSVWREWIQA